jgi:hypothetical protein
MRRRSAALFAIILCAASAPLVSEEAPPSAAEAASRDLIERPRDFDGKTVVFEGEAIGQAMRRGESAWVNLLDDYAALGVFMPAAAARDITSFGSSKRKGDIVRVKGVFRRACPEHGGDMDIHAEGIEIVERGKPTPDPIGLPLLVLIPVSFAAAAAFYALWRRMKASVAA